MTMTTAINRDAIGELVRATTPKGNEVIGTLESVKGGWATVMMDDGERVKVRNSKWSRKAIEPVVDGDDGSDGGMDEAKVDGAAILGDEQVAEVEDSGNGDGSGDDDHDHNHSDAPLTVRAKVHGFTDDPDVARVYMEANDIRPIEYLGGATWVIHFMSATERKDAKELDLGDGMVLEIEAADGEPKTTNPDDDSYERPLGLEGKVQAGMIHYDKSRYVRYKTSDGQKGIDRGDEVARQLRGKELDEVYDIVAGVLGVPVDELKAKYRHLNKGQQRMNLGNRMRKAVRAGAKADR